MRNLWRAFIEGLASLASPIKREDFDAYLEGYSMAFDPHPKAPERLYFKNDAEALRADCEAVMGDLKKAIGDYRNSGANGISSSKSFSKEEGETRDPS